MKSSIYYIAPTAGGSCEQVGGEFFDGENFSVGIARQLICARCPVWQACLAQSGIELPGHRAVLCATGEDGNGLEGSVWGGLSKKTRDNLLEIEDLDERLRTAYDMRTAAAEAALRRYRKEGLELLPKSKD